MILIVTDANIFIHLSRLDLIDSFVTMDFEIHTTDYIINEYNKGIKKEITFKRLDKYIRSEDIKIHEFSYEELLEVYEQKKKLSIADCSIYKLSMKLEAILLTGDKALKLFSEENGIRVHGLFWLIEKMYKNEIIDEIEYNEKLTEIKSISSRLPVDEIDRK